MLTATSSRGASNGVLCLRVFQGHACQFVGQCDGQLVPVHSFRCSDQPITKAEVWPSIGADQDDLCGLNEEHPRVSTAAFRNTAEHRLPARAVLSGNQADPGGEIPSSPECLSRANRGNHCRRDHLSDARNGHDINAVLLCSANLFDLF